MSTVVTLFSFFLSGSVAHRDLHSFPTRRSSDLLARGGIESKQIAGIVRGEKQVPGGGQDPCDAFAVADLMVPNDIADRKSTRLNSSHVAISYAVFCLKKKKKNNSILH